MVPAKMGAAMSPQQRKCTDRVSDVECLSQREGVGEPGEGVTHFDLYVISKCVVDQRKEGLKRSCSRQRGHCVLCLGSECTHYIIQCSRGPWKSGTGDTLGSV